MTLRSSGFEAAGGSGLVSVILGTASGAQNLGVIGALGLGGYIILAGLWAAPSPAPLLTLPAPSAPTWSQQTSPATGSTSPAHWWVPQSRSPPPTPSAARVVARGTGAAQGALHTEVEHPDQT